jgi:hypothetical protein
VVSCYCLCLWVLLCLCLLRRMCNIETICRLCGTTDGIKVNIFDPRMLYVYTIQELLPVMVRATVSVVCLLPQMCYLNVIDPCCVLFKYYVKKHSLTQHIYKFFSLLVSALLTSHHQTFFFIRILPVKPILSCRISFSFLYSMRHRTLLP